MAGPLMHASTWRRLPAAYTLRREARRCATSLVTAAVRVNHHTGFPATAPAAPAASVTATPKAPAVALDVEYAHYVTSEGRQVSVPAWVAVVDQDCAVLLKTFIQQQVPNDASWFGGVSPSPCKEGVSLPSVLQQLQQITADRLLLGHGLRKDLAALGLTHPQAMQFDTMTHPAFCNKSGNARNLKQLAKQHLAKDIQRQRVAQPRRTRRPKAQPSPTAVQQQQLQEQQHQLQGKQPPQQARKQLQEQQQAWEPHGHDPEEDAAAVMQLYQQVVYPSTYEGKVAAATVKVLASTQHHQQQHLKEHRQEEEEEGRAGSGAA